MKHFSFAMLWVAFFPAAGSLPAQTARTVPPDPAALSRADAESAFEAFRTGTEGLEADALRLPPRAAGARIREAERLETERRAAQARWFAGWDQQMALSRRACDRRMRDLRRVEREIESENAAELVDRMIEALEAQAGDDLKDAAPDPAQEPLRAQLAALRSLREAQAGKQQASGALLAQLRKLRGLMQAHLSEIDAQHREVAAEKVRQAEMARGWQRHFGYLRRIVAERASAPQPARTARAKESAR